MEGTNNALLEYPVHHWLLSLSLLVLLCINCFPINVMNVINMFTIVFG